MGSIDNNSNPRRDPVETILIAYESAWKRGEEPQIRDFLGETEDNAHQSTLVQKLVELDLVLRQQRGETPAPDDYVLELPEFSDVIGELFRPNGSLNSTVCLGLRPGGHVGDFELRTLLGQGGFGLVWLAYDRKLDREVALKMPRFLHANMKETDLFLREVHAAGKLVHPHIVQIYQAGLDENLVFIVSELIDGENLQDWLVTHRPDDLQAAELCRKLAGALQCAHAQGVIHRDVKAGNVLIDSQGEPKLTDFGLARLASDSKFSTIMQEGQVMGTPAYMSPEQAAGRSDLIDHRTDIYSLGVVLYRLITGKMPFVGTSSELIRMVQQLDPLPPRRVRKSVSQDLETICLKAIAKKPAARYQTAAELAEDLERFLVGKSIRAKREPWFRHRLRSLRQRMPVSAWGGIAALLIAVVALQGFSEHELKPNQQPVTITTEPAGAKFALVPLHRITHEPIPEKIWHSPQETPATVGVEPGDYLVVAYLADGRFHEVIRHVPTPDEVQAVHSRQAFPLSGSYGFFSIEYDTIVLPRILIPQKNVTQGMALIEGSERFRLEVTNPRPVKKELRRIPTFYIDPVEFTHADYKRTESSGGTRAKLARGIIEQLALPDEAPLRVSWHQAVILAERQGKRLPTVGEFQFAATNRGQTQFPWGNKIPDVAREITRFAPAGEPSFDCLNLAGQPKVYGLCSNVAEWTTTFCPLPAIAQSIPLVCGGSQMVIDGEPRVTVLERDPRRTESQRYDEIKPGLGFRMVRSAGPRLRPEDFESPLPRK